MRIVWALILGIVGIGASSWLTTSPAESLAMSSRHGSLLEKSIPALPWGFRMQPSDPWGHAMGEQTASQFAAYYDPLLITSKELKEGGFLDAYSEFASRSNHKKSDYLTISLVRLTNAAVADQVGSAFRDIQTQSLTPAPRGGVVKKVTIPGIPGAQAYEGWFEGSAYTDIVFVRDGVVADLDRTSPSRSVADTLPKFAKQLYGRLVFGMPGLT